MWSPRSFETSVFSFQEKSFQNKHLGEDFRVGVPKEGWIAAKQHLPASLAAQPFQETLPKALRKPLKPWHITENDRKTLQKSTFWIPKKPSTNVVFIPKSHRNRSNPSCPTQSQAKTSRNQTTQRQKKEDKKGNERDHEKELKTLH